MKRLAVVISLVLFVLAGPSAHAKLTGGEKTKLKKALAIYLNILGDKDARVKAHEEISEFFADKRKRADLADVEELAELLAHSMERETARGDVVLEGEWTFKQDFNRDEQGRFAYAISIPKRYSGSSRSNGWPLIVCLPDKGQTPTEYLDKYWANKTIRAGYLIAVLGFDYADIPVEKMRTVTEDDKVRMEKYTEKAPFTWTGEGFEWALNRFWLTVTKLQLRDYKVDPNRIILDGTGIGATGVIVRASDQAWRFSGLVIRGGECDRVTLPNIAGLPVLAYASGAVSDESRKTYETLKGIAAEKFVSGTNAPGWSATEGDAGGEELLAWLDGCVRKRYPVPSRWIRSEDVQQIGYWCAINEAHVSDQPSEVTIDVDKKKNKLLIKTSNVASMDMYLNDLLVNLDKPVELWINDVLMDTLTFERSPDLFLGHLFRRAPVDSGAVFTAQILSIAVDAPAPEIGDGEGEKKPEEGKPEEGKPGEGGGDKAE